VRLLVTRNLRGVAQCVNGTCCTNEALMSVSGDNGGVEAKTSTLPSGILGVLIESKRLLFAYLQRRSTVITSFMVAVILRFLG
jgi:hypothetical protein